MDIVIVGLDETKSVLIISSKSKAIAEAIVRTGPRTDYYVRARGLFGRCQRDSLCHCRTPSASGIERNYL